MPGSGGGPAPRFGEASPLAPARGGSRAGGAGNESFVLDHAEPLGCSLRRLRNSTCSFCAACSFMRA